MAEKKPTKKKTSGGKKPKKKEVIKEIKEIESNIQKEEAREEKDIPSKTQIKKENKIMFIFLGILLLISSVLVIYLLTLNSAKSFTYNGVKYSLVKNGKLTFYETTLPLVYNGQKKYFNLFIRNDPKTLEREVPFNGSIYIKSAMDLNYSDSLTCNGDGVIALANLANLYQAIGTRVVRDPNATCDPQQRYVFINVKVSNETSIMETAPACYTINVANCQILPATERFITETLSSIHNYLNSS